MEPLRVVVALLLLAGLASAADYGTVSTLDISLAPGESAARTQEVSRCRDEGCTDTLRLTASGPPDISVAVSPPEIKVEKARVGQTFSANVTVAAKAAATPGRYEGFLQVTSGSGDTWRYRLNITVGQVAAAPPVAGRTSPGTGGATGGSTSGATAGGSDPTLLIVGGGAVVAVVLLLILQRRGLLPRGVPRPAPRGRGRGAREILRPVGTIGAAMDRLKGVVPGMTRIRRGSLFARASPQMDDSEVDHEWERLVKQKLPDDDPAAEALDAPAEDAPPPMVGDSPPEEIMPPEGGPGPDAPEPPVVMGDAEPMEAEPVPGEATEAMSDESLAGLQQDVEQLRAGMGTLGDLKTMVERSLDDLRILREEVDKVRSAPRPPGAPGPAMVPPDALKKLQADMKQELTAVLESQMAANTEKLGTWLREAVKAVTLMKAQAPQTGTPGTTGLQPLFDGLWKEVGQLRNAIQRLETETKGSLQDLARQRAPGDNLVKEAAALKFAMEKQQSELAALAEEVETLRTEGGKRGPESGVALQADLEALRTILRDHQRQMEGAEARLKNQEFTFARGDEVRNLFRDLSALREDLAEVRMQLEEGAVRVPMAPITAPSRAPVMAEVPAPPPRAPVHREGTDVEEARKEIERQEAFLRSLEEYHRSGLMPERLYLEKKAQSEERLRELKRKARL